MGLKKASNYVSEENMVFHVKFIGSRPVQGIRFRNRLWPKTNIRDFFLKEKSKIDAFLTYILF